MTPMTPEQLARLLKRRMKELDLTTYALHMSIAGKASHQTVYNAINGKPIKTDTLLLLMDRLGLKIVAKD